MNNYLQTIGRPKVLESICLAIGLSATLPLIYLILRSFNADSSSWLWLIRLNTLEILWRSVSLAISVMILSFAIGIPLGIIIFKSDVKWSRFWDIATVLPLVIPSYVGAYLFISITQPKGLAQRLLEPLIGVDRFPNLYGFTGSLIVLGILNYPYVLLTMRSAIKQLDPSEEESARTLGLSPLATLLRVTIPQLRPAILSGGLLVGLYVLSDFGAVSLLRYKTFTWAIYNQYEASFDRNTAALLALFLCSVASIFVYLESIPKSKSNYYRTSSGTARQLPLIRLGKMQLPCLVFCGIIFVVSVLIPISVLLYWLFNGLQNGENIQLFFRPAINSLTISILTASVVSIAVIPIAYLSCRRKNKLSFLIEKICYTGFALPSIAVSISLVFLASKIGNPVYQSLWVLIFGCFILYLPTGLGAVKSTMLQISPSLEESSRTLGLGSISTSTNITLPLLRPGIIAGFAIVFLVTMKELPAVLMLSPLDFRTLTTDIWSYSSEAFFAQAAIPSLSLIIISAIPISLVFIKTNLKN